MRSLYFLLLSTVIIVSSCSENVLNPETTVDKEEPLLTDQQWVDLCLSDQQVLNLLHQDAQIKGKFMDLMLDQFPFNQSYLELLSEMSLDIEYRDGKYYLQIDGISLEVLFSFAEDCGSYQAGDLIPADLFSLSSYITDVVISISGIKYKEGPLFCLLKDGIEFEWPNRIRLTPLLEKIAINFNLYYPDPEVEDLVIQLKTGWQRLRDLYDQIKTEKRYQAIPDPFTYLYNNISKNITLNQLIYQQDGYTIVDLEGFIISVIDSMKIYSQSYLDELNNFITVYYSDVAQQDILGMVTYNSDLTGGVLSLADDKTIPFGQP